MRHGRFLPLVCALLLVLAACGGDDSGSSGGADDGGGGTETVAPASSGEDATTVAGATTDATEEEAAPSGNRRLRFYNFWSIDGTGQAIDVYLFEDAGGKKRIAENLGYGQLSDDIAVGESADYEIRKAGEPEDSQPIFSGGATIPEGQRWTVVTHYARNMSDEDSIAMQTFADVNDGTYEPDEPVQGGSVFGNAVVISNLSGDGYETFILGIPGQGCLPEPNAEEGITNLVGGTQSVQYDVPLGTQKIAAYSSDDGTCSQDPVVAAVPVEVKQDVRTYLLVTGTSDTDLSLTVMVP